MASSNHITFDDSLLSIDSHPKEHIVACGTMEGAIYLYSHSESGSHQLSSKIGLRQQYCRALKFSKSGQRLFCGSKDKKLSTIDYATGKVVHCHTSAHSTPLTTIHCISERLLVSGDESGVIKIWDTRTSKAVGKLKENSDFISDMTSVLDKHSLLVTSGDGSLSCVDLRQKKLEERSDCSESDLLCIAVLKGGNKVVCGDGEGVLGIFNWGLWGDTTDRFPCHPRYMSVDSCVKLNDTVLFTGCMDGKIRAVQILPNKVLCTVGEHSNTYPVDNLRLNHDSTVLISSTYDSVKFWSTSEIPTVWTDSKDDAVDWDNEEEEDEDDEENERERNSKRKKRKRKWQKLAEEESRTKKCNNFFDDL